MNANFDDLNVLKISRVEKSKSYFENRKFFIKTTKLKFTQENKIKSFSEFFDSSLHKNKTKRKQFSFKVFLTDVFSQGKNQAHPLKMQNADV